MKMKTFIGKDMPEVMRQVRETLGDDSVILSTRKAGVKGIIVTAAADHTDEREKAAAASIHSLVRHVPEPIKQTGPTIREVLSFHNLPNDWMDKVLLRYQPKGVSAISGNMKSQLASFLENAFTFEPLPLSGKGWRIMLVGAPGIGKTIAVAKIAAERVLKGLPITVITADNKRAGGVEQLAAFTDILKIDLLVVDDAAQLENLLARLPKDACVIIDSAGANPYILEEIRELSAYTRLPGVEPVLVVSAGGDVREAEESARAFAYLGPKRMLVTRADTARRLGSVLTSALAAQLQFCNISSAAGAAEGCDALTPAYLATRLLNPLSQN